MAQNTVKTVGLSLIAGSALSGTYQSMNPGGLPHACFLIRIVNDSDNRIFISFDGVNNDEYLAAGTSFDLNSQTNAQPGALYALVPKYTQVYVKGTSGTGNVTLSGYYV